MMVALEGGTPLPTRRSWAKRRADWAVTRSLGMGSCVVRGCSWGGGWGGCDMFSLGVVGGKQMFEHAQQAMV